MMNIMSFDSADLFLTQYDVMALSKRIEQLDIEVNTQTLRVKIEKSKRQRLGTCSTSPFSAQTR